MNLFVYNYTSKRFEVTYDKPSSYQGPIVEGWPPSKNRSVSKYLSGNFILINPVVTNHSIAKPIFQLMPVCILIFRGIYDSTDKGKIDQPCPRSYCSESTRSFRSKRILQRNMGSIWYV